MSTEPKWIFRALRLGVGFIIGVLIAATGAIIAPDEMTKEAGLAAWHIQWFLCIWIGVKISECFFGND